MRLFFSRASTQPRDTWTSSLKEAPKEMASKFPFPTLCDNHSSFSKATYSSICIKKNATSSWCVSYLPFFTFLVFFPVSFLSLFLFWLFPPLTRLVRSWVGSLVISTHSSFWTSDSDATFPSLKILSLLPKTTHIYSSRAL